MNIFFLHRDPSRAAKAQCDKHVVKMVLETTQMLSTAARRNGFDRGYKSAHPNHPMTIWVGDNDSNFSWALEHYQKNTQLVIQNFTPVKKLLMNFYHLEMEILCIFQNHHNVCQMNLNKMILSVHTEIIIFIKLVSGNCLLNGLKV
jgi:hypothetical protein